MRGGGEAPAERIHVDRARIEQLAGIFERTWQRAPTRAELTGLVEEFVREEVAYREALALRLDRDDVIVRRRMRQKLEFLAEDESAIAEPDDAALARHLAEHAERWREEPRVALRQIFVSREAGEAAAQARARSLLDALAREPEAAVAGDPSLLPSSVALAPLREVARTFGDAFADAVAQREPGRWTGPIESAFGLHLVLVETREEARMPALDEVREAVREDWLGEQRRAESERFHERLRARYEVTIDPLDAVTPAASRDPGARGR